MPKYEALVAQRVCLRVTITAKSKREAKRRLNAMDWYDEDESKHECLQSNVCDIERVTEG